MPTRSWSTNCCETVATASAGRGTGWTWSGSPESDGFAIDGERPTAWRYRDYVIRAFNNDKPYDVFVQEQLAGDEMQRRRGGRGDGQIENEGILASGFCEWVHGSAMPTSTRSSGWTG